LGLASEANADVLEGLTAFASERDVSLLDVAIGGLLAQPGVAAVIAGATTPEQVRANVQASDYVPRGKDVRLLDELAPTKKPQPPRRPGPPQQQQQEQKPKQKRPAPAAPAT